ncbi:MAG: nitrilase-related carbon-nitrogen hydrolase [candidate division Zixibacteria bacterium]|nr:nitrilase-related carbon-nitrogen hydrolase [candidate division Zixibacteria bacterium]
MKTGFIQLAPILGNVEATIRKLDRLITTDEAADLLVLPELCNSGYNFQSVSHAWELSEKISDSVFVRFLESKCRKHNLHIISGFNERDGDNLYNTSLLIGPQGYIGKYRKLHLFLNEKDIFAPGDVGVQVFDIGLCRLGMLICFDWVFPEVWRVLALKSADLICHPSNLVIPGLAQRAIPVHALTNRIYIVTANRTGVEGDLSFTGQSVIADPNGEILARASAAGEEVTVIDMDVSLARDKMITSRNHLFEDRRPGEYTSLVKP